MRNDENWKLEINFGVKLQSRRVNSGGVPRMYLFLWTEVVQDLSPTKTNI